MRFASTTCWVLGSVVFGNAQVWCEPLEQQNATDRGQTVNLGSAAAFGALAPAGITNTGSTVINGSIGTTGTSTLPIMTVSAWDCMLTRAKASLAFLQDYTRALSKLPMELRLKRMPTTLQRTSKVKVLLRLEMEQESTLFKV